MDKSNLDNVWEGPACVWEEVEGGGRLEKVANNHKQTTIGKIKREARGRERERWMLKGGWEGLSLIMVFLVLWGVD